MLLYELPGEQLDPTDAFPKKLYASTAGFDPARKVVRMRKRWGLLFVAAAILLVMIMYPWFGCSIDTKQVQVSLSKGWTVATQDGVAAGFTFNITNHGSCDLHLDAVKVTLLAATYRDGSVERLEFTEAEDKSAVIQPGHTEKGDFTFGHMFPRNPTQLKLRVEMSLREVGTIVVFEGQVEIPVRT